jgi:pseudouridine-5'-phosphate glycosidase
LTAGELESLARGGDKVSKVSSRDFGLVLARGATGGTTVAGTLNAAALVGIRVFATGGIGGVHRGDSLDISADITALASHRVAVVSAGAKSILDLPRTLELLETSGVAVIGYRCDHFPAFYARSSGLELFARVDSPIEAARVMQAHWGLGFGGGIVFTNPIPERAALEWAELESWIETALGEAARAGVIGKALTPFLLDRLAEASGGRSLEANIALLKDNARVATEIAVAYAKLPEE